MAAERRWGKGSDALAHNSFRRRQGRPARYRTAGLPSNKISDAQIVA